MVHYVLGRDVRAEVNCRKPYDLTCFSVLEVKWSLLSILNGTSHPEIDSTCHDEIVSNGHELIDSTCHDEIVSNVQELTRLPSCEYKNRKLYNMLKLAVNLRGSYFIGLMETRDDHHRSCSLSHV